MTNDSQTNQPTDSEEWWLKDELAQIERQLEQQLHEAESKGFLDGLRHPRTYEIEEINCAYEGARAYLFNEWEAKISRGRRLPPAPTDEEIAAFAEKSLRVRSRFLKQDHRFRSPSESNSHFSAPK